MNVGGNFNKLGNEIISIIEYKTSHSLSSPPASILIHGSIGSGKTTFIKNMILNNETLNLPSKYIHCSSLFQKETGAGEAFLSNVFTSSISILILDDIDCLTSRSSISLLSHLFSSASQHLRCIISLTSRLSSLPQKLMLAHKITHRFEFPTPDLLTRVQILTRLFTKLKNLSTAEKTQLIQQLSERTNGYSPGDLHRICIDGVYTNDFQQAMRNSLCAVSSLRSVKSNVLRITKNSIRFNDLYGISELKTELFKLILNPLLNGEEYVKLGIPAPRGLLLYGQSGVGKTAIANALAYEAMATANLNCLSIQSSDIISKIVGESEKKLANIFRKAREAAPAILIIEGIDALASKRSYSSSSSGGVTMDRLLSCLLMEMDGVVTGASDVLVVSTCLDKTRLDPAVLRPGRFDYHINVAGFSEETAVAFIKEMLRKRTQFDLSQDEIERIVASLSPNVSPRGRGSGNGLVNGGGDFELFQRICAKCASEGYPRESCRVLGFY